MASQVEITLRMVDAFFDRPRVMRSIDKERRKRLSKAGAFVRRGARRKIRKGRRFQSRDSRGRFKSGFTRTISSPGQPPRTHVERGRTIKLILFSYDATTESVIVGPVRFANKSGVNVPRVLEHGGRSKFRTKAGDLVNTFVQPRPFMEPTLREEAPKFPELFADSVR